MNFFHMNGLDDIIDYKLRILFIGFNPGLRSAETGHHYAGKSNGFWKLLHESGLTPYRFQPEEDRKLLELGFGSTNIVERPTRGIAEIKADEYREGTRRLMDMLFEYKPRIACYVGIGVYKKLTGMGKVIHGLQPKSVVPGVSDYVCPSPSGLNRMPYNEQLQHFKRLKQVLERYT